MSFIYNWKFKKWQQEMQESVYNSDSSLRAYMSLEVYPEDIEIFINVLKPKIFQIENRFFFDINGEYEPIVRQAYSNPDTILRTDGERQKDWNSVNVSDIFFNNRDKSSNKTIMNIAHLIKRNWQSYLKEIIPNKKFVVEIYGDEFEPWITFYQL